MKRSELIRCPMCGGVDLDIYEDTRNAFRQSLRGIEAIHGDPEYVRIYGCCVECSRRWAQYGLTVSQFAGQPVIDDLHSYASMLHWYEPGYGFLFEATWVCHPLWGGFVGYWNRLESMGSNEFQEFASWHETHVEVYHNNYAECSPHRTIVDCDGTALAELTWHWTDEEMP